MRTSLHHGSVLFKGEGHSNDQRLGRFGRVGWWVGPTARAGSAPVGVRGLWPGHGLSRGPAGGREDDPARRPAVAGSAFEQPSLAVAQLRALIEQLATRRDERLVLETADGRRG